MRKKLLKLIQWSAFFAACPFLMAGSGLMWISDTCHDKAIGL
jgi:hypothetical protein